MEDHTWVYKAVIPKKRSDGTTMQHRRCDHCGGAEIVEVCKSGEPCESCDGSKCGCPNHGAKAFWNATKYEIDDHGNYKKSKVLRAKVRPDKDSKGKV